MDSPQFLVHDVEVAHILKAKDDIRNSPSPVVFLSRWREWLGAIQFAGIYVPKRTIHVGVGQSLYPDVCCDV